MKTEICTNTGSVVVMDDEEWARFSNKGGLILDLEDDIYVVFGRKMQKLWTFFTGGRGKPVDGDRFNCVRSNWAVSEAPQSGVPGVTWEERSKRWTVRVGRKNLGTFRRVEDAIARRNEAVGA